MSAPAELLGVGPALRAGYGALGQARAALVLGGLLMFFSELFRLSALYALWSAAVGLAATGATLVAQGAQQTAPSKAVWVALAFALALVTLGWVLSGLVMPGYLVTLRSALRSALRSVGGAGRSGVAGSADGGAVQAMDVFRGSQRSGAMMVAWLLSRLVPLGTALAGALPGVIIAVVGRALGSEALTFGGIVATIAVALVGLLHGLLGVMFVPFGVALDGLSATGSLRQSWEIARDRRARLIGVALTLVGIRLASLLGVLGLGIGLLYTVPAGRAYTDAILTDLYMKASAPR